MVFCNIACDNVKKDGKKVTILILIDGFLQYYWQRNLLQCIYSHNPYFNRWFSAIGCKKELEIQMELSQSLF